MYLLIRNISEYTAAHVLLGVFGTAEELERARGEYTAKYTADPTSDPWRNQAYKDPGLASKDWVVEEVVGSAQDGAEVFIVSNYFEGFGQVVRKFDSIHHSAIDANKRVAELDAVEDRFPHYALVQQVLVGTLLSDAPEEQPRLI
jgi:hypothetical protein